MVTCVRDHEKDHGIIEQISIAARAADPWQGISADVIRRFVDVLCAHSMRCRRSCSRHITPTCRPCDHWLIETKQRTLVSATDEDVREYISVSLSCLRAFYGFLVRLRCRDDDPTEPDRAPRATLALRRDREH